jgi:hypothetical protein
VDEGADQRQRGAIATFVGGDVGGYMAVAPF